MTHQIRPPSKELVTRAIRFQDPERIPLVFRTDPDRSDIVQVGFADLTGWVADSKGEDEWGCLWDNLIGTGIGQVVNHPLASWEGLPRYSIPKPHVARRFGEVEAAVRRYPEKYVAGAMGISGFHRMAALRGFENMLADLYVHPDQARELSDRVFEFDHGIIEEYARRNVNGIWYFEDWGAEHGLMIQPQMWRTLFKPRYAEQFRFIHSKGMHVFFHTCGDVWDIIPDLIEIGGDVLNVEQPLVFGNEAINGIDRLAKTFGGKVCLCTNVDSQRTLISGTIREIEEEAKHIVSALGRPDGGLIPLADCGKDHHIVPIENVEAMGKAFERYSR